MSAFRYRAINTQGKVVKGTLEGDAERQIRSQLRQQKLKPLSVERVAINDEKSDGGTSFLSSISFAPRTNVKDLTLFTRQLSSLVQSGMPLVEALQGVAKQTRKNSVKDIVLQIRSKVLEGRSLAQSLAEYPKTFDSMYRAMVNAGEQAGFLGPVLERLSEYAETSHEARQKLSSAMVYPIILVFVCIAIVVALIVLVVPQLTSVFSRAKQELPWATELLIGSSDFLQNYGLFVLFALILAIMFFKWWVSAAANKRRWHALLLKLPIVKHIIVQADSSRFASTLSMLLDSGVPLLNSLRISNQTMGNIVLRESAEQAAVAVQEGSSLHKALDNTEIFPPLMVQMAASGEANGTLAEQLGYSAKSQERELGLQLSAALSVVEPLTMVFMGSIIGFIMYAIIIPIVNMSDLI